MSELTFKVAAESKTSTVDNKQRKEVLVNSPKCWIEDYFLEIERDLFLSYARAYNIDGKEFSRFAGTLYSLSILVKEEKSVLVDVRFKMQKAADADNRISDGEIAKLKSKFSAGVEKFWNGKLKLKIQDPLCGEKILPIVYSATWVEEGEHFVVHMNQSIEREMVDGKGMHLSVQTKEWTFAHEFGHCVGLPDEYSNTEVDEIVRYVKPSGELDKDLVIYPIGQEHKNKEPTIMSSRGNVKTKKRHAWQIAIESRKLLSQATGRKIVCDII